MAGRQRESKLPAPWLRSLRIDDHVPTEKEYPFSLPWLNEQFAIDFEEPVTILVGENGSGKSTLIEAIAVIAGFPTTGGGRWAGNDHGSEPVEGPASLARLFRAGWLPKIGAGWFLRAGNFMNVAQQIAGDHLSVSHGEGFVNVIAERMSGQGIFILDEPEAALSPRRQAELLSFIASIQRDADAQVIMATHSPILMAVPGATLLQLTRHGLEKVSLHQTDHFRIYQSFAIDPKAFVSAALNGDLDSLT